MHVTKITREQVYRAVMLRERSSAMPVGAPLELIESDPDAFDLLNDHYEELYHEAMRNTLTALGELLNILADEMDIDIPAIRRR